MPLPADRVALEKRIRAPSRLALLTYFRGGATMR
jgi:hypothetical protein